MAKKKKEEVVEEPQIENIVEAPKPKPVVKETKKDTWEIKDRMYYLTQGRSPLTYLIKASRIYWFDECVS